MSAWTSLTTALVTAALPTDIAALYATWLAANPAKADRLEEITEEVVATFRESAANPNHGEIPDDETQIPTSGYRHAVNLIIFNLGMEMGVQFAPEVYSLCNQANIWLRMMQTGAFKSIGAPTEGTPSYTAPDPVVLLA